MSDTRWTNRRVSRRRFLKTAGLTGLGAATVGLAPRPVRAQAPAVARGAKLAILQGTYFIAPAQDLYKRQAQEFAQAAGATVTTDFLN